MQHKIHKLPSNFNFFKSCWKATTNRKTMVGYMLPHVIGVVSLIPRLGETRARYYWCTRNTETKQYREGYSRNPAWGKHHSIRAAVELIQEAHNE